MLKFVFTFTILLGQLWQRKGLHNLAFWILRVCLDIAYFVKNWKHCSKIIFKCVNSAVWPIFNESFVEKIGLWGSWIVHEPLESWNVLLKKIKSINANVQLSSVSKQILEDSISVRIFIINIYIYIKPKLLTSPQFSTSAFIF